MITRVQKWGNSLAVRIPKALAEEIGLQDNSPVNVSLLDQHVVIKPVLNPDSTLEELLALVTDENRHGEVMTGPPRGGEVW